MIVRLLLFVLLAGCAASPAPPPPITGHVETTGGACATDADCAMTIIDPETCCDHCSPQPITRAAEEATRARCGASSQEGKCPVLDCPDPGRHAPACKEHQCVLVRVSVE
jgi:hypothetical protein